MYCFSLQDYDACAQNPCHNGGSCITELRSPNYTCNCSHGYNGVICQNNIDDCVDVTCSPPKTECVDGVASYTCMCPTGKTFSGLKDDTRCVVDPVLRDCCDEYAL